MLPTYGASENQQTSCFNMFLYFYEELLVPYFFKTMVSYIVKYFYCCFVCSLFKKSTHGVDINLTWLLQRSVSMGTRWESIH